MPAPASSSPPSAGPTTEPNWLSTWNIADAVANCRAATSRGIIAFRVGLSNAVRPARAAGTANSGQIRAPRSVLSARPALQHAIRVSTRISSRRRSVASITDPPYSEQASSGMSCASETRPTSSDEWVSR
jgi:hypothetical protein